MATYWSLTVNVSLPSAEVDSLNGPPDRSPVVLKPWIVRTSRSPLPSGSPLNTSELFTFVKKTVGKAPAPTRIFPDVASVGV